MVGDNLQLSLGGFFNSHLVVAVARAGLGPGESRSWPSQLSVSPGQLCSPGCFCGMRLVRGTGELSEANRQVCPGLDGD